MRGLCSLGLGTILLKRTLSLFHCADLFIGAPLPYFATLATLSLYIGSKRGLLNKDAEIIGFKQGATAPMFLSVSIFGI